MDKEKYNQEVSKLLKEFREHSKCNNTIVDFIGYRDWLEKQVVEQRVKENVVLDSVSNRRELSIAFYKWLCKRHDYQQYNPNINFDMFIEESNL